MISCRELTTAIASDELATASWRKRLSIRFHLMRCKHCRCYQRQVKALGGVIRQLAGKAQQPSPELEERIVQGCLGECGEERDS